MQLIKWCKYLIGRQIVGVSRLLPPGAFHRVSVDVRVVYGHDGVRRGLLGGKSKIKKRKVLKFGIK